MKHLNGKKQDPTLSNQEIANTIIRIAKDLNVFVRAANRRNMIVDTSMGQMTGVFHVAVSNFVPALSASTTDQEWQDDIEKRAEALINAGFREVDKSKLKQVTDGDTTTIQEAISENGEATKE